MANISTVAPYVGAGSAEPKTRKSIFRRVFDALIELQQRRADRRIAAILSRYADTPGHVIQAERERERRSYPLDQVR